MTSDTISSSSPEPENSPTAKEYISRGWIQYAKGLFVEAEADFRQANQLDGQLIDGHYGLGITLRSLGRNAEAIENLLKAQELVENQQIVIDSARRSILRQLIDTQISILYSTRRTREP